MTDLRHGWKILTHDGRSPLQGGEPILNGRFPVTLPSVGLDTGLEECAAGWNYVADIPTGWRIAGMWPTGRPARVIQVEASADAIERGDKRRASSLTLLREATKEEVQASLLAFSSMFGVHQARMAHEQAAWRHALERPRHDPAEVEMQLALALSARELPWSLRRFETARDARDAWAAWAARSAWDDRDARDARAAWDAWDDRDDRDARSAWDAWDDRDARSAWDAWDAWDARDAWTALTILYVRLMSWQAGEPDQYTVGIRESYRHGLAVALPVGPTTLGWAMESQ